MATSKKRALFALVGIAALAVAGIAYAYFTSTGSGTATATVGSSSALTLKGTVSGTLYPGSSATVNFTVDNGSSAAERVNTISLASITADKEHSTCSVTVGSGAGADFTMTPVAVNKTFGSGANQAVTQTGTLLMNDTGVSQNACQGATLTLNLTSN